MFFRFPSLTMSSVAASVFLLANAWGKNFYAYASESSSSKIQSAPDAHAARPSSKGGLRFERDVFEGDAHCQGNSKIQEEIENELGQNPFLRADTYVSGHISHHAQEAKPFCANYTIYRSSSNTKGSLCALSCEGLEKALALSIALAFERNPEVKNIPTPQDPWKDHKGWASIGLGFAPGWLPNAGMQLEGKITYAPFSSLPLEVFLGGAYAWSRPMRGHLGDIAYLGVLTGVSFPLYQKNNVQFAPFTQFELGNYLFSVQNSQESLSSLHFALAGGGSLRALLGPIQLGLDFGVKGHLGSLPARLSSSVANEPLGAFGSSTFGPFFLTHVGTRFF